MQFDSLILPNEAFWKVFKETPGALSTAEALCIIQLAAMVEGNNFIELGVNRGKSALAASQSLPNGTFHLVEPEFTNEEWEKGTALKVFDSAKNHLLINTIADYSINVLEKYAPYAYVFVDSGSHGDGLPMAEVKLLEDRLVPNGIIAFHDLFSQFHEVTEAYNYLLSTGRYEEIPINWNEINDYVIENNLEKSNNSWHHTELATPNFLGALKRKHEL